MRASFRKRAHLRVGGLGGKIAQTYRDAREELSDTVVEERVYRHHSLTEACARLTYWLSNGTGFPTFIPGPAFSDAGGWNAVQYYSTIQMADVNGDGKADVCARAAAGFECWLSNGAGFPTSIPGPALSDALGWNAVQYYSTIQMADVNGDGKADVCARAIAGFNCWLSNGSGFPASVPGPALSDALGWNAVKYYSTIQMADVNGDGKADVCVRAIAGFNCWLSSGSGFPTSIPGPAFSDAGGWSAVQYYSTIHTADVNGDGRVDVCARGNAGLDCALSNGAGFPTATSGVGWSDASGWNQLQYYSTIMFAGK